MRQRHQKVNDSHINAFNAPNSVQTPILQSDMRGGGRGNTQNKNPK